MAKTAKRIGLGKGLEALLPSVEFSKEKGMTFKTEDEEMLNDGSFGTIEISKIKQNPYQPRSDFDKQALEDLKNSIIEHGIIQPVTVRRSVNGYELISGERRLRAAKEAGFAKIPAFILVVQSDVEMLEKAMIENLQRENLNPIEIAHGYQRLLEECKLTQEEVAEKVSKDRSTVTNFLRLLRLPERIQESLRSKEITVGHARAMLGLSTQERMQQAWQEIMNKGLSVRASEALIKDIETGKLVFDEKLKRFVKPRPKKKDSKSHVSPETAAVLEDKENKLRHLFGTQVKISTKAKDKGSIEIEFYSPEEFERIIEILENIQSN